MKACERQPKVLVGFLYCGIYLAAVVVAGILKYLNNVIQTIIGQRALADMRKALYHHILTLPLNFFRKTQPGMVVSSIITELHTSWSWTLSPFSIKRGLDRS